MATEVAGRWFLFNPVWKGFHSHPALILWILFTGSIWLAPVPVVEKPVKDTKMRSVWPFDDPDTKWTQQLELNLTLVLQAQ